MPQCAWRWVLLGALGAQRLCAAQGAEPVTHPSFAVRLKDGTLVEYTKPTEQRGHSFVFIDARLEGVVTPSADHQWTLEIRTKNVEIKEVWFPWEPKARVHNENLDDDVLYYPHLMGLAWSARWLSEAGWKGGDYPGYCFAPLAVLADGSEGRIVAATNWPPSKVSVQYSRYRLGLRYDVLIRANSVRSFHALVADVEVDPAIGRLPWHRALDLYKKWLNERMKGEGLYPILYPTWMRSIEGWQNVQLQNLKDAELSRVRENWNRFKGSFPWLQMWGQMSNFFPTDGEETGCCMDRPRMHHRYQSILPDIVRTVTDDRGHVGFYCRPRSPYGSMTAAGETDKQNREFLLGWTAHNKGTLGANAYYLDVLGAEYFGEPLAVAKMFGGEISRESVIERAVDIYPSAFLISGSLWGGWQCNTSPGQFLEHLDKGLPCVTFLRFGRYLMDDRIFFLGESNGDHVFWGTSRGYDYWTERQAFLLGAKFDAMRIAEDERNPDQMNRALEQMIRERERTNWWKRDPVYVDTVGLSEIPSGVDIRHFRGKGGEALLVVDNWRRKKDQHVKLFGRQIDIPVDQVKILIVEP